MKAEPKPKFISYNDIDRPAITSERFARIIPGKWYDILAVLETSKFVQVIMLLIGTHNHWSLMICIKFFSPFVCLVCFRYDLGSLGIKVKMFSYEGIGEVLKIVI